MLRLSLQLAGFLIGLVILAWCAKLAFGPKNQEGLRRLSEASPMLIAGLVATSGVGVIVNGLIFWLTIRPVRAIKLSDMLATNALATFLSYLPFKLSLMARVAIHRQRDKVPLALIGPWFAAIGVVLIATVGPILAVSIWRQRLDALWIIGLIVLLGVVAATISTLASLLGNARGLGLIQRWADRQPIGFLRRFVRSEPFCTFDEALAMLGRFPHVGVLIALRMADLTAMAARFYLAGRIVGSPMTPGDSFLGSIAYFLIGVFSPIGSLGAREGGTAGLLSQLGQIDLEQLALIAVVVTGAELIVNTFFAAVGITWLRPDRLIRTAQPTDLPSRDAHRTGHTQSDDR